MTGRSIRAIILALVPRPHWHLEVRIVKALPSSLEGFDTSRFEVGRVYDVNAPLCDLLVTSGFAVDGTAIATDVPPDTPAEPAKHARPRRAHANERSRTSHKNSKKKTR